MPGPKAPRGTVLQRGEFWRFEKYAVVLLAAAASLLMMVNLDNVALSGPDEPRYAEVAREMVERNDYVVLHFNGKKYSDKPPGYFWLIAAFSRLSGGVNEVAARMPSALAGVGTVLLAFGLARAMAATALMCLSLAAFAFFVFCPLTNGLTSPKKFGVVANRIVGDSELTGHGDVPTGVMYYSHHRVRLFGRPEDVAEYLGGGSGEWRFCVTPRENLDQIRDACGESVMLTVACEEVFDVSDMLLLEGRRAADVDGP